MMKRLTILLFLFIGLKASAQLPSPALVGYWENWFGNFAYFSEIDARYNVIMVSFASYKNKNDYELTFKPEPGKYWMDKDLFKNEMDSIRAEGKKVLISIGGATYPIMLDSLPEKEGFVSSVTEMIETWGFDGIDIDLEGSSLHFDEVKIGDLNAGDKRLRFMVEAIQEIMANYYSSHGKKLLLTMAPETHYVQGGMSEDFVINKHGGAYLPMIEALKDSIDMLNVQLYNSGAMPGIDGKNYSQSTPDFILALTESVIKGFEGAGDLGLFSGLPASKVGVGLPSCEGWGYTQPKVLDATMRYLLGEGPQPGNYSLIQENGYPELAGMMTWSLNIDQFCNHDPKSFVNLYDLLFNNIPYITISNPDSIFITEENGGKINVEVWKDAFVDQPSKEFFLLENLPKGVEMDSIHALNDSVIQITLKGNSAPGDEQFHIHNMAVKVSGEAFINSHDTLHKNWGVTFTSPGYFIPTRIQGEHYHIMAGSEIRPTSDDDDNTKLGGGTTGAYSDYHIIVPETKKYGFDFRYATGMHNKADYSILIDGEEVYRDTLAGTGGWDTFKTIGFDIPLTEGKHTLRIYINAGWYGLNWFEIKTETKSMIDLSKNTFETYPNPANDFITLNCNTGLISITNMRGKLIAQYNVKEYETININELPVGIYQIIHKNTSGDLSFSRFIKK
ncbi:MAG: hypothetical protein CMP61_04770 [Flavobacteriales bacterium]|nr:hypothetical protein [Flavobacteriales bacterium]